MPAKITKDEFKLNKKLILPFIGAICIGLPDTISKGYINRSNDFSFLFSLGLIQVPVALAYLKVENQPIRQSIQRFFAKISSYKYALLGGLFNIIGTGLLWLSFSFTQASIASPITGSSGALAVLFSRFILKEKISTNKRWGILLAIVGVMGVIISRVE